MEGPRPTAETGSRTSPQGPQGLAFTLAHPHPRSRRTPRSEHDARRGLETRARTRRRSKGFADRVGGPAEGARRSRSVDGGRPWAGARRPGCGSREAAGVASRRLALGQTPARREGACAPLWAREAPPSPVSPAVPPSSSSSSSGRSGGRPERERGASGRRSGLGALPLCERGSYVALLPKLWFYRLPGLLMLWLRPTHGEEVGLHSLARLT